MNIFSAVFGKDKACLGNGLEHRPQQVQMAETIEKAFLTKRHLMVEAGTGVGKSLAYLLPLIKWTLNNEKKAVVSTYTKTLQEQLIKKELPHLKQILGMDFRFALCLGSENYLCIRRSHQNAQAYLFETDKGKEESALFEKWFQKTKTGLRSELSFMPRQSVWDNICRQGELCMGRKCLFRKDCFYYKAKRQERNAHILVVNHHLFFSDIASGGKVLPHFNAVVFDEAHTLENTAASYLGIEVSNFQIKYFFDSLFNPATGKGVLNKIKELSSKEKDVLLKALGEVRAAAQLFFWAAALKFGKETKTVRIKEKQPVFNHLREPMLKLAQYLNETRRKIKDDEDKIEIGSFISRADKFAASLDTIIQAESEKYVYWVEILNRPRGMKYAFFAAPIDISEEFKKRVLDEIQPVIFTSATLSVGGAFDFFKKGLGIGTESDELILDSPFNYTKNALLYLPLGIPDPAREPESYLEQILKQVGDILAFMKGRTFILFTSFRMMDEVYSRLKEKFLDLLIFKQGDAPRYKLLSMFKRANNAVLLGTTTFWQGIDIPGKALECVIIAKLPFAVPDEPIVEAKMERLVSQHKDPFLHYQLPLAIVMLRQGFGRLIRTQQDRGMVAILDPRIRTRRYGRSFLEALPCCGQISELEQAKSFFMADENIEEGMNKRLDCIAK
ncbi:MAG: DEAD/DEAH box helicase [Candidatus Omnitrophica bacterium]|nr:DEAD/DEAH box helicase [Candidatus Omnitrophota bacterium]